MKQIYVKLFLTLSMSIILVIYLKTVQFNSYTRLTTFESFFQLNQLAINKNEFSYLNRYSFYLNCKNKNLTKWTQLKINKNQPHQIDYYKQTNEKNYNLRVTRGLIVYFPVEKHNDFLPELKWLYRSWIEMQKSEPLKWRTDLIVFIQNSIDELKDLNCTYENKRKSDQDPPACILLHYIPLQKRILTKIKNKNSINFNYDYLLNDLNIYSDNKHNLLPFYAQLKENLKNYDYTDSILMAFEGYKYFKEAKYDFLIRSDMDVFLTPLFSKWLPINCNDFYVGRGGYNVDFNRRRLLRIANDLGLKYANISNLGSTWYSTPDQFRLVSYLTLINMIYLTREEFSEPEINGEIGTSLWPYWHYGVLLLYGQHLGLNHLIATNQLNVIKLKDMLDYPSANTELINEKIHIHVFHGDDLFSKFAFKSGEYDNYTVVDIDAVKMSQVKYYCLKMALDAKRINATELNQMLVKETFIKI